MYLRILFTHYLHSAARLCGAVLTFLCLLCCGHGLYGQDSPEPLNSPGAYILTRLGILGVVADTIHPDIQPLRRGDVFAAAVGAVDSGSAMLSPFDLKYLLADNDEYFLALNDHSDAELLSGPPISRHPFLKIFYTRPAHLFAYDSPAFSLRVNPILDFSLGKESGDKDLLFVNRRGLALRGTIDRKVFFASDIVETQLRPPLYVRNYADRYRVLPDAGLIKHFNSSLFGGDGAYDYLNSSGYVGFHLTRHIGVQLGHGKNFIGDGYRSLFLSDFAKNYFYLKFNTRVWRFHYQNIFAELAASEKLPGNTLVPKKYLAAHYLSFSVRPNVTVGLFESVIFAREKNRFELQYLNPVILYRSIEHHVGSPDNVLIGLSGHWDVFHRIRFYGQFLLDEFKFNEFFSSRNWWGNKHGLQLGARYVNAFGVRDLDILIEYNRVRPFTYSHYDSLGSYAHFNQPLADPLGANFTELLVKLDYRPVPRLWLTAKLFSIQGGMDTDSTDYGSDILRPNVLRNAEYGISQNQGIPIENIILSFKASYMLKHNFFLDATFFRRNFDSAIETDDLLTTALTLGVRWNFFPSPQEF